MSRETKSGVVSGTVPYMSPEQIRATPVDHRSDIFSFGCVLYEMVTAKRPFTRETTPETMTAILKEDPPPISQEIPVELQRLIFHSLEKNPEDRFQSARDMAYDLKIIVSNAGASKPAVAARHIVGPSKRRPSKHVVVGAALMMLFGVLLWWMRGHLHPPVPEKSIAVLPFTTLAGRKKTNTSPMG